MKKILLTVLSIPILMSCSDSKKQEQADEAFETYTIEQFYENVSYYGGAFSPDESKLLVGNNSTGVFNAYEIDLASGTETALTQSDSNSIWAVSYFPEDERILYQSDNDGDEIDHIYVRQTDGTVEDLTPVEGAKANFMKWQRDNKSFLFTSNQREPRFFDLYEMDLETFSPGMLYQNDMGLDISAVSVDKRYLALVKNITTSKSEMHLFDRETDELTQLSPAGAEATFSPQFFSLDGEFLYYLTNLDDEFTYLSRYNMSSGATEKVFGTNWDVWYAYHTHNEKYRIIGINADGRTEIKIFDLASGEEVAFPEMPGKDIKGVNVSDSETLVRLTVGSSKSPNDIYLYNFETGSLEKLTDALNPDINAGHLVDAEVIRYESYDGLEIPSIYYKPKNASADNKAPALVWVHGGPGGQSRVGYFSLIQYLGMPF
jgi:dipeptidyl aminopeptidase/acylaminoacyl peptidase